MYRQDPGREEEEEEEAESRFAGDTVRKQEVQVGRVRTS